MAWLCPSLDRGWSRPRSGPGVPTPQAARLCPVPSTITHGRAAVFTAGRQIDYWLARNPGLQRAARPSPGPDGVISARFAPPGDLCAGAEPGPRGPITKAGVLASRYPGMAARRAPGRVLAVTTSGRSGATLDGRGRDHPGPQEGEGCHRYGSPSRAGRPAQADADGRSRHSPWIPGTPTSPGPSDCSANRGGRLAPVCAAPGKCRMPPGAASQPRRQRPRPEPQRRHDHHLTRANGGWRRSPWKRSASWKAIQAPWIANGRRSLPHGAQPRSLA